MIRYGLLMVLLAASLRIALGSGAEPSPAKEAKPANSPQVTVVIDYGDGVQKHFTAIPWKEGLTVLDAMRAAQAHPRGIRFEHKGNGDSAMLTKIDDLGNEGRGRNWMYRVDGKLAVVSFGVQQLASRSSVLWKFE